MLIPLNGGTNVAAVTSKLDAIEHMHPKCYTQGGAREHSPFLSLDGTAAARTPCGMLVCPGWCFLSFFGERNYIFLEYENTIH